MSAFIGFPLKPQLEEGSATYRKENMQRLWGRMELGAFEEQRVGPVSVVSKESVRLREMGPCVWPQRPWGGVWALF